MLLLLVGLALVTPQAPLRLADLLEEARRNNPELQAAREQARAAAAQVVPAGALDDPMLMVQLWNTPADFSTVPVMVQLSQTFPLGGKRAARRDAARGEAAATQADAATKAREIEAAVAKVYFDLYLADRTLEVDRQIEAILRSLLTSATSRMAAGKGEQAEALRAQSELLKVQSDSEGVRARRVAASAKLVALLNRAPGSALGMTTEPGLVENLPTQEALRARSLRERPEFAGTQARTAQAEARLRLAKAERVPDLTIFLAEMHSFRMTGVSDFLFAGVQGNLPIFAASKNRGRIETASAQRAATHAEERALQNRIFAEIADAYAEVTAERRQIDLHHQLIPVARQALASALSAYAAGRGSFLLVLDSERDLLMHEIDLATHRAMYEQRLADLERAVGGDLGLAQAAESGSRERH